MTLGAAVSGLFGTGVGVRDGKQAARVSTIARAKAERARELRRLLVELEAERDEAVMYDSLWPARCKRKSGQRAISLVSADLSPIQAEKRSGIQFRSRGDALQAGIDRRNNHRESTGGNRKLAVGVKSPVI